MEAWNVTETYVKADSQMAVSSNKTACLEETVSGALEMLFVI